MKKKKTYGACFFVLLGGRCYTQTCPTLTAESSITQKPAKEGDLYRELEAKINMGKVAIRRRTSDAEIVILISVCLTPLFSKHLE